MPSFNMDDYVGVHERLALAHDLIQMIITEPPIMLTDAMGFIRATVGLTDGRSATGVASFRLDLQGRGAQVTNPLEDCETSAVGRALAFLGFAASRGIASREEIQEAQRRQAAPQRQPTPAPDRKAPAQQLAPARETNGANPLQEKRAHLASLRTDALRAGIKYTPPQSPGNMSQMELEVAINQLEMLLGAKLAHAVPTPSEKAALVD